MGIQSRDWYKSNAGGAWGDWGLYQLTPVVQYIIIANVAVFLLQIFSIREIRHSPLEIIRRHNPELDRLIKERGDDPDALEALMKENPRLRRLLEDQDFAEMAGFTERVSIVQRWCELDSRKVVRQGQIWRLLTHAFCHDRHGVWHIFFNMLFFYWFGCTLESMYGSREFLLFYLTAAVVAGLAFVGLDMWTGSTSPGIGASGAVMAVTMLYALHFPRETILIFWLIPIEIRWLVVAYVIFDLHPLLLQLAGDRRNTGIAHAAHLGGLAFGFVYGIRQWRLAPLIGWLPGLRERSSPRRLPRVASRPRLRVVPAPEPEPVPDAEMLQVDDILRKISEQGQASLTDAERDLLMRASQKMKKRDSGRS